MLTLYEYHNSLLCIKIGASSLLVLFLCEYHYWSLWRCIHGKHKTGVLYRPKWCADCGSKQFLEKLLSTETQYADVLKGELLVKEVLPQDGSHQSHAIYSLVSDRNTKVSWSNSDVAPLSEDDWVACCNWKDCRSLASLHSGRQSCKLVK